MIERIHALLREKWQALGFDSPDMRGVRLVIINGGVSVRSKLVCLCWKPGEQTPTLVIKVPRYPRYNSRLEVEYATLKRLRRYLPDGDGGAPRPLASVEMDGLRVTVESASHGRMLRAYLREHPQQYRQELERMKPFADWLAGLHARSATVATPQQLQQLIFAPLAAAEAQFNLSEVEKAAIRRLREDANRLCADYPLPIVFNHNDCGTTNILVDRQGRFSSIIDWEWGEPGLPCVDLMDFLGRYAYETRAADGDDPLKGYREMFFYDSEPVGPLRLAASQAMQPLDPGIAVRWLNDYCKQIGLAPRWLAVLFGLGAIMRAHYEKSAVVELRSEGQLLHGMPRTVSATTADDTMMERGHFRSQLRYYLENLDDFAPAHKFGSGKGLDILVVTPFLPYPQARSGCPRAVFDRVALLAREHRVSVVTFAMPGEQRRASELERLGVKVYWVPHDPQAGLSGWKQWRKRARLFVGLLCTARPMLVTEFHSARMGGLLSSLLSRRTFDVIMVEHILMAQYLDESGVDKGAPVVLTEHDVRLAVPDGAANGASALKARMDALDRARWLRYERWACRQASVVTVPTAEDAGVLEGLLPGLRPVVVPFGMGSQSEDGCSTEAERDSDTLLFVGNFNHPPNVDAALWLCKDILPLVRKQRPSARVWLVGKDPTPEVLALSGDGVRVIGEVPSVEPYLRRCALFVAPLRMGGGMRMKLIEALSMGAPVVTTRLAAHGFQVEHRKHVLLADDASGMAAAILEALGDRELRLAMSRYGREWAASQDRVEERLSRLSAVLWEVRRKKEEGRSMRVDGLVTGL